MKIRITVDDDQTQYPHQIQLLDMSEEMRRAGLPPLIAVESGNDRDHPKLDKVRFGSPIKNGTSISIPSQDIIIECSPYGSQHASLTHKLTFRGLKKALSGLGLPVELPKGEFTLRVKLPVADRAPSNGPQDKNRRGANAKDGGSIGFDHDGTALKDAVAGDRVFQIQNAPTVEAYVRGLTSIRHRITETHIRLFQAHYKAPNRTATSAQLASWAAVKGGHLVVNRLYGKLGHVLCDQLGIQPDLRPDDTYRWWSVWSRGRQTAAGFVWEMLPQLAEALERLGWVAPAPFVLPDEIESSAGLVEGAVSQVLVNAYERNPEARRQCIDEYGSSCCICEFNFGTTYGEVANGYIHVHHIRPLSEVGGEYVVNPAEDLRPVCPNCHAVLHRRVPPYSIEEVRSFLWSRKHIG